MVKDLEERYALDIVDLSKQFKRQTARKAGYSTIKSSIVSSLFTRSKISDEQVTVAVKDLTVRIPRGSSFGIIGKNGSGKSTLLKLITGIYKADKGTVSVNGRIAALIELGAGFHPDFTGRENVYLAGVMYGLSRSEIDERFEKIVKFAELEEVIDDPVRTYSSGMFMRLGFSLAVHTEPDVLLVDEVLSVGDAGFVSKCKDKLAELRQSGITLLLVSHDLDAVERWCDEALWLQKGEVMDRGDPRRVIDAYRQFLENGQEEDLAEAEEENSEVTELTEVASEEETEPQRWGSREVEITSVSMSDDRGEERHLFHPDDKVKIEINYKVTEPVSKLVFGIGINRNDGLVIHGTNTSIDRIEVPAPGSGGKVSYTIERLGVLDGAYSLDVAVHDPDEYPYDYQKGVVDFLVRSSAKQLGVVLPESSWSFEVY